MSEYICGGDGEQKESTNLREKIIGMQVVDSEGSSLAKSKNQLPYVVCTRLEKIDVQHLLGVRL